MKSRDGWGSLFFWANEEAKNGTLSRIEEAIACGFEL